MESLLQQTLLAMFNLLQFYSDSFTEMNLDGLFGLRIIEGQCKNFQKIAGTSDLRQQFFECSESAVRTAIVALPHLENKDPEYFKKV